MTVNELRATLQSEVEKDPSVGDMIITAVKAPSHLDNYTKLEDNLVSFSIYAVSRDESRMCVIVGKPPRFV